MKPMGKVVFWRNPELMGLECCRVEHSRHAFPNHAHDGLYAFGIMEKGATYCLSRNSDTVTEPGKLALINPGQIHSGIPVGDVRTTYRMVYVDADLMTSLAGDLRGQVDSLPEFKRLIVPARQLGGMLTRLCGLMELSDDALEIESVLLETMAALLTSHGGVRMERQHRQHHSKVVNSAKEFMTADLEQKLTLKTIAESVGLSRYHFLRVFKRATGLSPHTFRTLKRIDLAKKRLLQGVSPIQVALETGFTDQSHFTRTFRQMTGATPGQYLSV